MEPARVLIVANVPASLAGLQSVLRRSRYELVAASDPRAALRLAHDQPPDLVLIDLHKAALSAHEFLRRYRRMQRRPQSPAFLRVETPVVVLTGGATRSQRVANLDAGAADYLSKPYDPDELRARIRSQIRRVAQHRQRVAAARLELLQMESTLGGICDVVRAAQQPLLDLKSFLELSEAARQPGARSEVLARARRDIRQVLHVLARLVERT